MDVEQLAAGTPLKPSLDWPDRRSFFDAGLRFECQRCGVCCTGDPGIVQVDEAERRALAGRFGMGVDEFTRHYCRPLGGVYSLKEHADGRCILYDNGCLAYDQRPRQCRTFPFWICNLRSEAAWKKAGEECPGFGEGRLYGKEEILAMMG